jgi:IS1 family transposase/transposase-like protein
MPCIKAVGNVSCKYCKNETIKYGKASGSQPYRCKKCSKIQLVVYKKHAYKTSINFDIAAHVKEGCGIRSIARLLRISATTVLKRIKAIADSINKPMIPTGKVYEVDELRTYNNNKTCECWIIYALDKQSGRTVDFRVGNRSKKNLKMVVDTLLLAKCKKIYTDGLNLYRGIIPPELHATKRYGTNRIERKNLSLRIHLKRLNRKTICYSKSLTMLSACLRIYFWYDKFFNHPNILLGSCREHLSL